MKKYYFKLKIHFFLIQIFLVLLSLFSIKSQVVAQSRIYRQFATQSVDQQLRQNDETIAYSRQAIERYVKNYQLNGDLPNFIIPIIFHHVYDDKKISPSTIENQLNALNTAFQYNHNWQHPAHDILNIENLTPPSGGIQFCFANVDLMGDGSIGYNYMQVDVDEWSIDGLISTALNNNAVSGFDFTAYKPDNYLNIWIVDLPEKEAGYAQMPWGPKKSDGIIINRKIFEPLETKFSAYNQGKTLVHLVGSYLGLYELWSDTSPCVDDRVFDTPIHNAPNYGAYTQFRHISLCDGAPVAQTMNYMDATDDDNMYLFTKGQMLRVAAMLSKGGPRGNLRDAQSLCSQSLFTENAAARNKIELKSQKNIQFQIAPNPAKDQVTITYSSDEDFHSFQLYNVNGQLLQTSIVAKGSSFVRMGCSAYPDGIYFITAQGSSVKQTQRFTLSK